jgi:O-antigen ligase
VRLYEKYLKIYFYFLLIAIPLAFIQKCEDAYYLPKLILLLTGLQYGYIALRKIKFDLIDKTAGVFLLVYALGFINSPDRVTGFLSWASWAACICVFLYARYALPPGDRKKAALAAMLSAFIASLYAVAQAFRLDLPGWVTDFSGRAFSSMGNPDFFGGFLALVIPLCLYLFYGYGRRNLPAVLMAFFASILFLSQTRSSIFAFAASLAMMVFFFREYFLKNLPVLLASAAAGALLVFLTGKHAGLAERIKSMSPQNQDLQGRVSMWLAGLGSIRHNLFIGSGLNGIKEVFDAYRAGGKYFETEHLHNDYIEIAAESGLPALAVFVLFLAFALRRLLSLGNAPGKIVFISAAAMLAHAFFNFPFYVMDTKLYFFVFLGVGLGGGEGEAPGRDTLIAGLLSACMMLMALPMLCGSVYLNYGINADRANNPAAGDLLAGAVKYYPGPKKYYYAADFLFKQRDYKNAMKYSEKFLAGTPASKTGCIQAGIIAAEAGDMGRALDYFNGFLRYYPDDADVLNNKAKAQFMAGRPQDAIETYRRIIMIAPDDQLAHDSLMAVYFNQGMKAEIETEKLRWEDLNHKSQITNPR